MNVNCPGCNNSYKLDERRIPSSGQKMRCPKCKVSFLVSPTGATTISEETKPLQSVLPKRPIKTASIAPENNFSLPPVLGDPTSSSDAFADLPGLPNDEDLGEIDLPTPADVSDYLGRKIERQSEVPDLPALKDESNFGDIDLSDDVDQVDLPTPKSSPDNDLFGGIDLPAPSKRNVLPTSKPPQSEDPFGEVDLPAPVAGIDLSSPDQDDPFGGIDLPAPAETIDLPTPAGFTDLPAPAETIDLPTPAGFTDLPTPSILSDLPTPAGFTDLPAPSILSDLPTPSASTELPTPKKHTTNPPLSMPPGDLSMDSDFPILPEPTDDDDIFEDLEGTSQNQPTDFAEEPLERVKTSGTTDFGEISLEDNSDDDNDEFDGFPVEKSEEERPKRDDDSLELGADPMENRSIGTLIDDPSHIQNESEKSGRKSSAKFDGRRKHERQNRKSKTLFLLIILLTLGGGGSLYFTPWGPFGMTAIANLLPNASAKKIVLQLNTEIDRSLKLDTYIDMTRALEDLDLARKELPHNEDLRIAGVFLNNWYQIRYGRSKAHHTAASKLLGEIVLEENDSLYSFPAKASTDLCALRIPAVVNKFKGNANPTATELALLGEATLLGGNLTKALDVANKLLKKESDARGLFLKARALNTAKDMITADVILKQLIKSNPNHLDSKLLLASNQISRNKRDFDAIKTLLTSVHDQGKEICSTRQSARAHALKGKLYLKSQQQLEAGQEFDLAEALNKKDEIMLIGKGDIALINEDILGASSYFVRARSENPSSLDAQLGQINTMIRQGLLSDSKDLINELLPNNDKNAKLHYLLGLVEMKIKNIQLAEKEFSLAVTLSQDYIEPYVALSQLYIRTGRDKEAMKVLDKAGAAVPNSPIVKITLADGHAAREDYASAIVSLNEALEIQPNNIHAHFKIAQMYRKMGVISDAKSALEEVKRINPDYNYLILEQGQLMELSGTMEAALAIYEQALVADPDNYHAMIRLGSASLFLEDFEKAKEILSKAIVITPRSAEANYLLGEVFRATDRSSDAGPYLKTACELDDGNALYHLRYGMALMEVRNMPKAMIQFIIAKKLDPKMAETYVRIGDLKLRSGSARDAITILDQALAIDPKLPEAYALVGEAFEELSDLRSAAHYYTKALIELPDDAHLHFKFALTQMQIKGNRAAAGILTTAITKANEQDINPNWLPEAYYRLGVSQMSSGKKAQAIDSFKSYLKIAPEQAIDRSEVLSHLDRLEH